MEILATCFVAFEIGLTTHWLSSHEVGSILESEAHSKKTLEDTMGWEIVKIMHITLFSLSTTNHGYLRSSS